MYTKILTQTNKQTKKIEQTMRLNVGQIEIAIKGKNGNFKAELI
jgi:hypothetical protein